MSMQQQQHILINSNGVSQNSNATLQHYLVNNHISNGSESGSLKNVHVQLVKQEANSQPQQRYIINRQYVQTQNQEQQIHQQQKIYWIIVEIESNNETNSYALVESKDVVGNPQLETLTTGKLVIVNLNNKQRRATVVMASSDKNFLFAEYSQLNKMAEDNLKLKEMQARKRRRISGSDIARKDAEDDSSLSAWSGVSQNVTNERVVSPSLHIKKSTYERYCPPMTYDQGTQTDTKLTGSSGDFGDKIRELQRLIELNEHILNEQKLVRNETKTNRFLLEQYNEEFSSIRRSIQSLESKIENLNYTRLPFEQIPQEANVIEKRESASKTASSSGNGNQDQFFIIENAVPDSENASMSLTGSNVEYTVEELQTDDSVRSASRLSYDQTSMMSNISVDGGRKDGGNFRRSHSSSNFSVISSTPLARSSSSSNLIEEWADMEGDVVIGSNQTAVPVHILRAIDWKNYKAATRKLLVTIFPRTVLASRSLTGRPSPAFHDRNKPVKEKLDQNIINDIIQIITRKCGVHESQVRTAITTKCADENKMMRSREVKCKIDKEDFDKFKPPLSNGNDDKENSFAVIKQT